MKLTELIEKITPLPLELLVRNDATRQLVIVVHGTEVATCHHKPTAAYLVHCANVLPDLVKALELTHNFHNRYFTTQSMDEFRAAGYTGTDGAEEMKQWLFDLRKNALTRAQEVKI